MLNIDTLSEIISDTAIESETLYRVGLVGSFARGDFTISSDVDLVFDTDNKLIDEAIMTAGLKIRSIIYDQFRKKTDIINYYTILKYKEYNDSNVCTEGYKKMLEDIIWLWRKKV